MSDLDVYDDEEEFSPFGELDIDEISDDPFYIEPGTYPWVVTKGYYKDRVDPDSQEKLTSAVYSLGVDSPGSQYHGKPNTVAFAVYPRMTRERYNALAEVDPELRQKVDRDMSNHKMFLRGIGLSESEISQVRRNTVAELTVGKEFIADLEINESKGKTYKNMRNFKQKDDSPEADDSTAWLTNPNDGGME